MSSPTPKYNASEIHVSGKEILPMAIGMTVTGPIAVACNVYLLYLFVRFKQLQKKEGLSIMYIE